MSSPKLLDVEALLAPIAQDQPSGSVLPFEIRRQLDEARKEDDPDSFAAEDPMRPTQFKKADWRGIVQLTQDTLRQTSKDLLVAARLTEALVKEHGFAGLRDGLRLLHGLVEQCWDRLHPQIEDGDVEVRAGPFVWLADPIRGILPNALKHVPLLVVKKGSYNHVNIKGDKNFLPAMTPDELNQAISDASAEQVVRLAEDITQARQELNELIACLNTKMGPAAPALMAVVGVLDECDVLVQGIVRIKRPLLIAESDSEGKEPSLESTGTNSARAATSRAEAYRQLSQAAAVLRELEPHSPIPYLVQRAVELGALPFPLLMKALIRDINVLGEMNRELGIKEESSESS